MIMQNRFAEANKALEADLKNDFEALGAQLSKRNKGHNGMDLRVFLVNQNREIFSKSWRIVLS